MVIANPGSANGLPGSSYGGRGSSRGSLMGDTPDDTMNNPINLGSVNSYKPIVTGTNFGARLG